MGFLSSIGSFFTSAVKAAVPALITGGATAALQKVTPGASFALPIARGVAGAAAPFVGLPSTSAGSLLTPLIKSQFGRFAAPATALAPSLRGAIGRAMVPALGVGTFLQRFPALGARIQKWRIAGVPMTFNKLRGMLRRWGPTVLVTMGVLTADELIDLVIASTTIKRRRMNVANVTALRRGMRRIEGFHKLCMKADILKGGGRRVSRRQIGARDQRGQIIQVK